MKTLPVKLVRQPKNSSDCGPACIAMVLDFYKIPYNYDQLRKDIGVASWGTVTPQLGLYLLKKGFDVEIVSMHPALFSLNQKFKNNAELLNHLKRIKPDLKGKFNPTAYRYFIKFIETGGKLTPKIPDDIDIRNEIKAGRPVLVPLTHWFLSNKTYNPRLTIHYNIITGIDHNKISVNDPDWGNPFGGKHIYNTKDYLYAIYASTNGGIDDACLMKIKRK